MPLIKIITTVYLLSFKVISNSEQIQQSPLSAPVPTTQSTEVSSPLDSQYTSSLRTRHVRDALQRNGRRLLLL